MTTKRKSGLGRGLEALIPTESASDQPTYLEIDVAAVSPNPEQPRTHFDEDALDELAASISEVGVLQPIVVAAIEDGYSLIAGERRWRAASKAGLTTIPAVIREPSGETSVVEALVENIQRQDLTPLEEAQAYSTLLEKSGMKQKEIAERVGKSPSAVSNTLRLLQLPESVQALVDDGSLSAGHARALLALEDEKYALYVAERAAGEGWSVRQVEEAVRDRKDSGDSTAGSTVRQVRPVEIIELEKRLSTILGSKVKISYRKEKGKVEIRFASLADLERIYRQLS